MKGNNIIIMTLLMHLHINHSYGGMLTAWIRFKYPNLVDGGLAASAPIFYTEGLVPRIAFFGKVTEVNMYMYMHVDI